MDDASARSGGIPGLRWLRDERNRVLATMALALPLIGALYANALHGPFQFDDRHAILENPVLHTAAVDWSWWGPRAWAIGAGHYRPFTFVTYAMNIRFGGLDPVGFHVVNVTVHWAGTAILLWLLWLLLHRATPAIIGGLLFAVTPANSEAVNYVAARSSLLVGLWSAAALAAFVVFRRAQAEGRRLTALTAGAGALIALGLGLGSKEVAVTVPLVWLCYDAGWSRSLPRKALWWPYGVIAALAVAYFAATGYHRTLWSVFAGAPSGDRNVWVNLWSQLAAFPKHLTLFFWPFSLNVLHDVPTMTSPARPVVLVGSVLTMAVGLLGARWLVGASTERKTAGFLLLWFVLSLLPTMIYPLHVLFQEHRDYLPWMGLAGVSGLATWMMGNRFGQRPVARRAGVIAGVLILGLWSAATVARNSVWTDALRLWADAAVKSPAHPAVRLNLGTEYVRAGDPARALAEFEEAIRLQPDYGLAHHNVGLLYLGQGAYTQARAAFEQAAAFAPNAAEPLAALGTVYEALGESTRAEATLMRAAAALERRPQPPAARLAVADAFAKSGRGAEAAKHYQAVLIREQNQPSFLSAKAYLGLGYLAERAGHPVEALAAYGKALAIDPHLNDARFNSANVLLAAGRYQEATAAYERLIADAPGFFHARFNLGRLYEREGRLDDARREYRAFLHDAPAGPAYASARQHAASRVEAGAVSNGPTESRP
jgi:tetratricopeptide (TPR) repeat protein